MLKDLRIVEKKVSVPFIDKQSGRLCAFLEDKHCLENEDGEDISREYYCMLDLGDDHYAVCDIVNHAMFYTRNDYYSVIKGEYKIINEPTFKWGIIRIKRDINGKVIPFAETMIVPYIYDRICNNNSKTATVYCGQCLTYVELDANRSYYGKQLVPCILENACPFDVPYEGFAECVIEDSIGYLPRNCKAKEYISRTELLTKKEVIKIIKYMSGKSDLVLDEETISKYYYLTGESLVSEDVKKLKKI